MLTTTLIRRRMVVAGVGSVFAFQAMSVANAQSPKGSDYLNTLGVGARSIAMGNAFTAIADDATATYWNPGRLGFLDKRTELIFQFRQTPLSFTNFDALGNVTHGFQPGDLQPTFMGMTYPLRLPHPRVKKEKPTGETGGKPSTKKSSSDQPSLDFGVLGISYALGGYFNSNVTDFSQSQDPNVRTIQDTLITNHYFTIAYGRRIPIKGGDLGVGASYYRLVQHVDFSDRTIGNQGGNTEQIQRNIGAGNGFTLGAVYSSEKRGPQNQKYMAGLTFRSGTDTNTQGQRSVAFGTEVPSRLSLGVAQEWEAKLGTVIVSVEAQAFSEANQSQTVEDTRKGIVNLHFGAELATKNPIIRIPFLTANPKNVAEYYRLGFRTNRSAVAYAIDENIFSVGLGLRIKTPNPGSFYYIEPTVEIFQNTGMMQWTLSGRFRF